MLIVYYIDISADLHEIASREDVKLLVQRDLNLHSESLSRFETVKYCFIAE